MSGQRGSAVAVLGPRPPKDDPAGRLAWNQKYRALKKEHFAAYRKQRAAKPTPVTIEPPTLDPAGELEQVLGPTPPRTPAPEVETAPVARGSLPEGDSEAPRPRLVFRTLILPE